MQCKQCALKLLGKIINSDWNHGPTLYVYKLIGGVDGVCPSNLRVFWWLGEGLGPCPCGVLWGYCGNIRWRGRCNNLWGSCTTGTRLVLIFLSITRVCPWWVLTDSVCDSLATDKTHSEKCPVRTTSNPPIYEKRWIAPLPSFGSELLPEMKESIVHKWL